MASRRPCNQYWSFGNGEAEGTFGGTIDELEDSSEIYERLENLISVYPFNEYEFMISTLLGREKLTLDDYYALRDEYIERNLYLYIFEISAPRGFGEKWAQGHLKELVQSVLNSAFDLSLTLDDCRDVASQICIRTGRAEHMR